MAIKRIKFMDIKKQKGATKKEYLDKLADAEIIEKAMSDPDSPVPTKKELEELKRVGRKDKPRNKSWAKRFELVWTKSKKQRAVAIGHT